MTISFLSSVTTYIKSQYCHCFNIIKKLIPLLYDRGAKDVKVCTLLHKTAREKYHNDLDYIGFFCEDHFVVGFGLDYNEYYRNLPYIGVLKKEIYNN